MLYGENTFGSLCSSFYIKGNSEESDSAELISVGIGASFATSKENTVSNDFVEAFWFSDNIVDFDLTLDNDSLRLKNRLKYHYPDVFTLKSVGKTIKLK